MDFLLGTLKNVMRKKLRTVLTISGIAIGVMSVIIISSIGDIGKHMVNTELDSMGISGICLRATGAAEKTIDKSAFSAIKDSDTVDVATPLISKITDIIIRKKLWQSVVWGVDANVQDIVTMELIHGRLLTHNDLRSYSKVCVVDEAFAKKTYSRSNIVGKTVKLKIDSGYEDFKIVGVVSSGGNLLQSVMGEIVPTFMYAPYTTITRLSKVNGFSQIVVKLNQNEDEQVAQAGLISTLNSLLNTKDAVKAENLNNQKEKLNSVLSIITSALSAIGGIALLVAGLSIMTVMLVTVSERTREIGIKKSIGASKSIILLEFLFEALLLSIIGSIFGCLIGVLFTALGCTLLNIPLIINLNTLLLLIAFCVFIGVLFGVYPALKAAGLRPVDALRNE